MLIRDRDVSRCAWTRGCAWRPFTQENTMLGACLFVLGPESIWIQRDDAKPHALVMRGPASNSRSVDFTDELSLQKFLADAELRLVSAGWTVQRFGPGEDRRQPATVPARSISRRRQ